MKPEGGRCWSLALVAIGISLQQTEENGIKKTDEMKSVGPRLSEYKIDAISSTGTNGWIVKWTDGNIL